MTASGVGWCQQQDRLKMVSLIVYVQDAMYSSYTSILLVVVTHCCLHSRYQQAEIGRAGTSRHQLLTDGRRDRDEEAGETCGRNETKNACQENRR